MIKRTYAIADNQITNAKRTNLLSSATLSNMGKADTGNIFSIFNYDGISTQSFQNDISRLLFKFNENDITFDENINNVYKHYLCLYDVRHDSNLPRNFTLVIHPITKSWEEGEGLDIDNYSDIGESNWQYASTGSAWQHTGSDFDSSYIYSQTFSKGYEDLEIDITDLVYLWKSGTLQNNGLVVKLTSSQEYSENSFYKKAFSLRGTQYWFSRPCIETRWKDATLDDRNNSYISSSLANSEDNLNTIYLLNKIRGKLSNIPTIEQNNIYVSLFTTSYITQSSFIGGFTGTWVDTGTYKVQFYSTYTGTVYDFWHDNSNIQIPLNYFFSSSINLKNFLDDYYSSNDEFILSMPNLKNFYHKNDKVRLDLYVRKREWKANVHTTMNQDRSLEYIHKAYYQIRRSLDSKIVIDYGTGSTQHTLLSYDKDCNYFNIDMKLLEPDYQYEISYLFEIEGKKILQKDKFKFRIDRDQLQ